MMEIFVQDETFLISSAHTLASYIASFVFEHTFPVGGELSFGNMVTASKLQEIKVQQIVHHAILKGFFWSLNRAE